MFKVLAEAGEQLAKQFIESGQDIFTMVTDVEGQEVTVLVKFSPPVKKIVVTPEGLWGMATMNETLTKY